MSAVEIEDVLSSIRRLVSEELRPLKRAAREALAPDAPDAPDDKLMLTPALRVVSDPAAQARHDTGAIIGRLADAIAPESSFEAEAGDPEPQDFGAPPLWPDAGDDDVAGMIVDAQADDATYDAEDDVAGIQNFVFHSRQAATDRSSPQVAAEAGLDGEILDPEHNTDLPAGQAWAQQGSPEDGPHAGAEEAPPAEALPDPGEDPVWADHAEAEVMASLSSIRHPEDAPPVSPEPLPATDLTDDDMHFDESVLRDLVRDLIREELQGALGERITRNVRKLVRAEVARALALHDFE